MFDTWTTRAKLLAITGLLILAALTVVVIKVTSPSAPTASVAPTAPASSSASPGTPSGSHTTPHDLTPQTPAAPTSPSAVETLQRLNYKLVSQSGSTSEWMPPLSVQPKVTLTATQAIAYFNGYSCAIPINGETVTKYTFFGVGQMIVFGEVLVKPSDLNRSTTKITVTSNSIPVGYMYCRRSLQRASGGGGGDIASSLGIQPLFFTISTTFASGSSPSLREHSSWP